MRLNGVRSVSHRTRIVSDGQMVRIVSNATGLVPNIPKSNGLTLVFNGPKLVSDHQMVSD